MKFFRRSTCLIVAILFLLPLASPPDAAEMEGVMMRNGKMMIVKHGKPAMPMDDDITVGDGTVVSELTVASGFGSPFELPAPPK